MGFDKQISIEIAWRLDRKNEDDTFIGIITVSSGADPYTLYVKSPERNITSFTGPLSSDTITTTAFNGENPSGTWTIWIVNNNVSLNGNIYPVSTVTVRIQVYYS